jgi:hypothetical protein
MFAIAAYAVALGVTLVLARYWTPRAWWRRANARALGVLAAGTLAIGTALLWIGQPQASANAAPLAAALPAIEEKPEPGAAYVTWDDLNLRGSRAISAPRMAVVPQGATVTATGRTQGDWWELTAQVDGREVRGWASSLWLRRPDEARARR